MEIKEIGKLGTVNNFEHFVKCSKLLTVPHSLVETGFTSNQEEEKRLNSDAYQNVIANSIVSGGLNYFGRNKEDVNRDGATDIKDIAFMARNHNMKTASTSLEKYMDINNDGIIDIYDLVLVSKKILP
jgi:hypothetical protein